MSFKIIPTDHFKKQAKKLAKKYKSLKIDLEQIGNELAKNPTTGTAMGNDVYKVRLSISSKAKGKSGGARLITCVKVLKEKVYLISIYEKSQLENLQKIKFLTC